MKLGIWSLSLAIIGLVMTNLFTTHMAVKFNIPDDAAMLFVDLGLLGGVLSFVAFFLSCYAILKGWKSKSRQQILLSAIGLVISSFVVLPTIFIIIVGILIGSNINHMIN